jgi:alginate O-acetyltransferase complex protein AlgF
MKIHRRNALKYLYVVGGSVLAPLSWGQQTTLYDPQPPANSAYVRVLAGGTQDIDIQLGNKPKAQKVNAGTPSPYLIVPAGKHEITVKAGPHTVVVPLNVEASRSLTVVLPQVSKETKPIVIEDKVNGNRLKAMVSAYHLGTGSAVDVWTADGTTQVFANVAPGAMAALAVNPIALDYMVSAAGQKTPLAQGKLSMSPGGAYAMVVMTDKNGKWTVQTHANSVERYAAQ